MTSLLIDARLSWGSGIGRYIANTVPRVADLMPDIDFKMLVGQDALQGARLAVGSRANLSVKSSNIIPFSLGEQMRLGAELKGFDLVWFTNYWVPLAVRSPFVVNVHDMLHQEPSLFPASRIKRALSHATFRHVAARARGVFYLSRFTQHEFERRYGVPANPVVISCGIDHDGWTLFDPAAPPAKRPQLLVVAAAKKHKNFRIAIDAFKAARVPPHWTLKVITPNDKLRSSIDLSGMVGASERIGFAQGLSNEALRAIYAETAILLMPSLYEGFGLPLAEGLQAGAQCISSTASSLVEVGQGARITYVNPLDLPGWIQAIETECARFDANGVDPAERTSNMRHALQFRWDKVASRVASTIRAALPR